MKRLSLLSLAFVTVAITACTRAQSGAPAAPAAVTAPSSAAPSDNAEALRKALNPFDTGPASVSGEHQAVVDGSRSFAWFLEPERNVKTEPDVVEIIAADRNAAKRTVGFRLVKPAAHSMTANMRGQNGENLGPMTIVSHGSNDEALAFIRKSGLRPATARELLDFAERHGDVIGSYCELVALGTVLEDAKNGETYVATVYRSDDGLHAIRHNAAMGPSSRTLFLAAPK